MNYVDGVWRGVGLLVWLVVATVVRVGGVLLRALLAPLWALGRVAERYDVPPEGAPCQLRGETHDWGEPDFNTRTCETCGKTEALGHPGL